MSNGGTCRYGFTLAIQAANAAVPALLGYFRTGLPGAFIPPLHIDYIARQYISQTPQPLHF
jgi:hypothetical protein